MPIKQHSAHTNSSTMVYYYTKQAYTKGSTSYSEGYMSYTKTTWGNWYDAWGGCSQYADGSYSNANYSKCSQTYTNYGQTTTSYSKTVNTTNKSPTLSGTPSPGDANWTNNTLTINLSGITFADSESNSRAGFRIYYQYKKTASASWNNWTIIGANESTLTSYTTTSTSYSWNISSVSQGFYRFAVTAYDGYTWSAILNSGKTGFTYHHRQLATASDSTSNNVRTVVTVTDVSESTTSSSYALSNEVFITRYTPPTWLTDPWKQATVEQIRNEINSVRDSFGLTEYTFSNTPVVADFTMVRVSDITEAQAALKPAATAAGYTATFTQIPTANTTEVNPDPIGELQKLIDTMNNN